MMSTAHDANHLTEKYREKPTASASVKPPHGCRRRFLQPQSHLRSNAASSVRPNTPWSKMWTSTVASLALDRLDLAKYYRNLRSDNGLATETTSRASSAGGGWMCTVVP